MLDEVLEAQEFLAKEEALVQSLYESALRQRKAQRRILAKQLLEAAVIMYEELSQLKKGELYVRILSLLGQVLIEEGLFRGAQRILETSAIIEANRIFGHKHYLTALCRATLADLCACQTKTNDAFAEFEAALPIIDSDDCPDQALRIEVLDKYRRLLLQVHRGEEARALEKRMHDIRIQHHLLN